MKYRYIISTADGDFFGTNDLQTAQYHFDNEDAYVADCKLGTSIDGDTIPEAEPPPEEVDSELPDDEPEAA